MNTIVFAFVSFVLVAGVTTLAGMTLMRFWPALQRERLGRGESVQSGPTSVLRWTDEPRAGWERTIEKIGLLTELRAREFYEKPTSERKRKKAAAVKRHFKRVRSMQLPKKLY